MPSIGTIALKLVCDSNPLATGLQQAGTAVKGFGSKITDTLSQAGGFISSLAGSMNPLTAALAGAGLALSGAGVVAFVKGEMQGIVATGKLADSLGISTEALTGLQYQASKSAMSSEELTHNLGHLLKELGGVAGGSQEAIDKFTALGLDGKALAKMPLDQALVAVGTRLSSLSDKAAQGRVAFELFGRSGRGMVKFLEGGAPGIAKFADEAKRLGLSFSRDDAAKVEIANGALKKLKETVRGFGIQAAIGVAPLMAVGLDALSSSLFTAEGLGAKFGKGLENTVIFGALTVDVFSRMAGGAAALTLALVPLTSVLSTVEKSSAAMAVLGAALPGFGSGSNSPFAMLAGAVIPGLAGVGGEGNAPATDKAKSLLDEFKEKVAKFRAEFNKGTDTLGDAEAMKRERELAKSVEEMTTGLRGQVATFGLSGSALQIWKKAQEGATEAQLAGARAAALELDQLNKLTEWQGQGQSLIGTFRKMREELRKGFFGGDLSGDAFFGGLLKLNDELDKKLGAKAAGLFDQTRAPFEKLQAQMQDLQEMLDRGQKGLPGGIDQDLFDRGLLAAQDEFLKTGQQSQQKFAGAALFGSQEAVSASNRFSFGSPDQGQSREERLQALIKEQKEIQKRQLEELKEIKQNGKNAQPVAVVGIP